MSVLSVVCACALLAPAVLSQSTSTIPVSSAVTTTSTPVTTTRPATSSVSTRRNHLSYSATYTPGVNLPAKSETGQTGTNTCGTTSSNSSDCQNVFVNSVQDFCLFGPPVAGELVGQTEVSRARNFCGLRLGDSHFVLAPLIGNRSRVLLE